MELGPEIRWLSWAVQVSLLAGVGYIIRALTGLRDDLQKQNGRTTILETWRPLHEKTEDERHRQADREREILIRDHQISREGVQNDLKLSRENMHDVSNKMATRADVNEVRARLDQLRDQVQGLHRPHGRRGEDV